MISASLSGLPNAQAAQSLQKLKQNSAPMQTLNALRSYSALIPILLAYHVHYHDDIPYSKFLQLIQNPLLLKKDYLNLVILIINSKLAIADKQFLLDTQNTDFLEILQQNFAGAIFGLFFEEPLLKKDTLI